MTIGLLAKLTNMLYTEMRKYLKSNGYGFTLIMGIFGIAPGRHSAQSAFRPAVVGIRARTRTHSMLDD